MRFSDRSFAYVFAAGLAGYPLVSYLPSFLGGVSRTYTVPFRGALLAAGLACAYVTLKRGDLKRLPTVFWISLLSFWFLYVLRITADTMFFPVPLGRPVAEYYLYGIGTCFLPMFAYFRRTHQGSCDSLMQILFWVLIVGNVLVLATNFQHFGTAFGRVYANEALNPITVGHMSVALLTLALVRLLVRRGTHPISATAAVVAIPLCAATLLLSGSRGPLIGLVVVIGCIAVLAQRSGARGRVVALIVVIAVVAPWAVVKGQESGSEIISRMVMTADRVDAGSERRLVIWSSAWEDFSNSPVLGSGLEERSILSYPHNVVLEAFMATGVIGGMFFVVALLFGFAAAMRLLRDAHDFAWIGILYVHQVVWSMFSGGIDTRQEMWYALAAVMAARWAMVSKANATRRNSLAGRHARINEATVGPSVGSR